MEQEVIASNSLSSNNDNGKNEEDKVPQLKLKQEPADISTSQQSRWINYGAYFIGDPVLVRSGQFSTIIYNFAELVKNFDFLDKNDLKKLNFKTSSSLRLRGSR